MKKIKNLLTTVQPATVFSTGLGTFRKSFAIALFAMLVARAWADVPLGPYNFNSSQFGNTLLESDGGIFSAANWLNTVNANPGNPGYLTGANFNTGIANIGLSASPVYTIGYSTPIVNGAGNDLGVVVARFSSDPVTIAFSSDGGATFTPNSVLPASSASATAVGQAYFYGANPAGPFLANLFVHPLDLSTFGFAGGASVNAVRVTGTTELDLIRVAGLAPIPEPASLTLAVGGSAVLAMLAARRRKTTPAGC